MDALEFAYEVRKRMQTIMVAGHQQRPERCGELAAEVAGLAGRFVEEEKERRANSPLMTEAPADYDLAALDLGGGMGAGE